MFEYRTTVTVMIIFIDPPEPDRRVQRRDGPWPIYENFERMQLVTLAQIRKVQRYPPFIAGTNTIVDPVACAGYIQYIYTTGTRVTYCIVRTLMTVDAKDSLFGIPQNLCQAQGNT